MEQKRETAWKDARELEYLRIDAALRARMNYTVVRNVYSILQQPFVLLQLVELDSDIWDCLRPYFSMKDNRRVEVDTDIDWLIEKAYIIADFARDSYGQTNEMGMVDIPVQDIEQIREFFNKEKILYRSMMDMRHEKGLDVGMRSYTSKTRRNKMIEGIARQSYDEEE